MLWMPTVGLPMLMRDANCTQLTSQETLMSAPTSSPTGGTAPSPGIAIHQQFPMGAFGPRQWSLSEMRRLFRWLRQLGYGRALMVPFPIFRLEDARHTILELGTAYQSGVTAPPGFEPGTCYCPSDRYLGTPEGLARAAQFRDQARAARDIGLQLWLMIIGGLGSPAYLQDHPELSSVRSGGLFFEGTEFCPSHPQGLSHLLEFWSQQVRYMDAFEGYILGLRDACGCGCRRCQPQDKTLTRVANSFYEMIQSVRPGAPVAFLSWHVKLPEVPELARRLHPKMLVFESPRIHAIDVPMSEYLARVREWQGQGRHVEGCIEVQENPTALLPPAYPERVARTIQTQRQAGLKGIWVSSTIAPYLFPLHLWLVPRLWDQPGREGLVEEFLTASFGAASVQPGLRYLRTTEQAWEKALGPSQVGHGFLGLFVMTFPFRLLPEKLMREGVPAQTRQDLETAATLAAQAYEEAQTFADSLRPFHALEANIIAASAEVFMHRVAMRRAKLAVLDAIHAGDGEAAAAAWPGVVAACEHMVAAARNAPNTDVLAQHWRRLELLPARVRGLALLLPELAEHKSFRPIRQSLHISELYLDETKQKPM